MLIDRERVKANRRIGMLETTAVEYGLFMYQASIER